MIIRMSMFFLKQMFYSQRLSFWLFWIVLSLITICVLISNESLHPIFIPENSILFPSGMEFLGVDQHINTHTQNKIYFYYYFCFVHDETVFCSNFLNTNVEHKFGNDAHINSKLQTSKCETMGTMVWWSLSCIWNKEPPTFVVVNVHCSIGWCIYYNAEGHCRAFWIGCLYHKMSTGNFFCNRCCTKCSYRLSISVDQVCIKLIEKDNNSFQNVQIMQLNIILEKRWYLCFDGLDSITI